MESEKRLIDANALRVRMFSYYGCVNENSSKEYYRGETLMNYEVADMIEYCIDNAPTVDAVEVVHGRWVFTTHEEYSNSGWNVTAECSECHLDKGEIWAGFFPGFPKELAAGVALANADCVKMDNYCPNCGAKMDGGKDDDGKRID